ncbi:hypothetical protein SDC9_132738 [bioreactor metagenome]|uniref:Rubrerythrin diiron-binding domain-containing protein n=1 Tax=bioreactor metagenome TaxID=1076179 RepID=A0A645D8X6_9ZZZZ
MDMKHGISITTRDRLLRAFEDSMELVRDYQCYSSEIEDDKRVFDVFKEFAEDEGTHASKLLEILKEYDAK